MLCSKWLHHRWGSQATFFLLPREHRGVDSLHSRGTETSQRQSRHLRNSITISIHCEILRHLSASHKVSNIYAILGGRINDLQIWIWNCQLTDLTDRQRADPFVHGRISNIKPGRRGEESIDFPMQSDLRNKTTSERTGQYQILVLSWLAYHRIAGEEEIKQAR